MSFDVWILLHLKGRWNALSQKGAWDGWWVSSRREQDTKRRARKESKKTETGSQTTEIRGESEKKKKKKKLTVGRVQHSKEVWRLRSVSFGLILPSHPLQPCGRWYFPPSSFQTSLSMSFSFRETLSSSFIHRTDVAISLYLVDGAFVPRERTGVSSNRRRERQHHIKFVLYCNVIIKKQIVLHLKIYSYSRTTAKFQILFDRTHSDFFEKLFRVFRVRPKKTLTTKKHQNNEKSNIVETNQKNSFF